AELQSALTRHPEPTARAALEVALAEHRRATLHGEQQRRLRDEFHHHLRVLPYLFAPSITLAELELLAAGLDA
ncbi:MAG: hypothetical protein KGL16_07820, partial [Acidobacteriota bacterium]|nr:hypothetical protein [Acidobacteriota bacterium]